MSRRIMGSMSMRPVTAYRFGGVRNCVVAFAVCVLSGIVAADAAERGFPYNSELIMDAKPMRGSKRVPMLVIGAKGEARIEGWCNNVEAQMVVAADTLTIPVSPVLDQPTTADPDLAHRPGPGREQPRVQQGVAALPDQRRMLGIEDDDVGPPSRREGAKPPPERLGQSEGAPGSRRQVGAHRQ